MQTSTLSNPVDVAIGAAVREQRLLRQKTLGQTASALAVSEALYALCEAGDIAFQAGDLFTLADFFGVRARDLMPSKETLVHVDPVARYGDPQEIRDLIYYFSGIVSPALRGFFLKQIEDASIEGHLGAPKQTAGVHAFPVKPEPASRKSRGAFGFLRAS